MRKEKKKEIAGSLKRRTHISVFHKHIKSVKLKSFSKAGLEIILKRLEIILKRLEIILKCLEVILKRLDISLETFFLIVVQQLASRHNKFFAFTEYL